MAIAELESYLKLLPNLKNSPGGTMWLSYDSEADTLYVNFKKPSQASESELRDDDVIIRYEGDEIVGFTVFDASRRSTQSKLPAS